MSSPQEGRPEHPFAGDSVFDLHVGGKMEIRSTVGLGSRDDLSLAYTPGVARVCEAIAADPSMTRHYTWVPNTVAVVTDGTAVLGLGDIGPAAAMPVMEGKAVLFKAVRRRRRHPDLPGHHRRRGDHRDRRPAGAELRRHQPGGHLGAAVLRDRAPAQGPARHPGLPRRPARHRRRGARRAPERAPAHRPRRLRRPASSSPARVRPGSRWPRSCSRRACATSPCSTARASSTPRVPT